MSNNFFSMKLLDIQSAILKCSNHFLVQNCMIKAPDDNRIRYVMCSPDVHNAVKNLLGTDSHNTRIRLVMPKERDIVTVVKMAAVEVYVDEDLRYRCGLIETPIELALALEVEIFNNILRNYNCHITTM